MSARPCYLRRLAAVVEAKATLTPAERAKVAHEIRQAAARIAILERGELAPLIGAARSVSDDASPNSDRALATHGDAAVDGRLILELREALARYLQPRRPPAREPEPGTETANRPQTGPGAEASETAK